MWRDSHYISSVLSLRRIDPYWRSQLLVEYSKDIGACTILDDPGGDDRYMVDDVVIYSYGRIFLTRFSSLKEKMLHATHEDFSSMHFNAYFQLMEEFTWEGIQHDIFQHMERCISRMVIERMSQLPSYSLGVRENFQLSHFRSRPQVHNGGGIISCFVLYLFSLFEQHDVTRRNISSCIVYDDVLVALILAIFLMSCRGSHMSLG